MAEKKRAVYAIYADKPHLEAAIGRLLAEGFREEDISMLVAEGRQSTAPGAGARAGRRARAPVASSETRWDCWPESEAD